MKGISDGSVSVFEVVIGFPVFFGIFIVGSVFGIGISKYRDIGSGIRYFSTFPFRACLCGTGIGHQLELAQCKPTFKGEEQERK